MQFLKHTPKEKDPEGFEDTSRYRMMGSLRRGERTDFWTAFDSRLNRIVLLKKLKKEHLPEEGLLQSFINETKLISYLDHPGVVSLYDSFLDEEREPCYTMKLLNANDLRMELDSKSHSQFLSIFVKLCETMAYVHDKGVSHLDLRPENVMVGNYGEVMIMDWGNARLHDDAPYKEYLKLVRDAPSPPIDEASHGRTGVNPYMSPEHTNDDREALSPSADIFSLGVILFEMMTGDVPFTARTKDALTEQITTVIPPLIHTINASVPWRLSGICAKMLKRDPFERYHSLHAVLRDFDMFRSSGLAFPSREYQAGDIIFQQGEPGEYAFMVVSGSVEVLKWDGEQHKVLVVLGKDEIVGELAILTNEPRTATVRAAVDHTVIRLMDRPSVEEELKKLSPWVETMIKGVSKRFVSLNDQMVGLRKQVEK